MDPFQRRTPAHACAGRGPCRVTSASRTDPRSPAAPLAGISPVPRGRRGRSGSPVHPRGRRSGSPGHFDTESRGAFAGDLVGLGRDAEGDRDRVEPSFLRPVADLLADVAVGDDVHHHIRAGAAVRGHARGRHYRGERGDVVVAIAAVELRRGQLDDVGLARQRSGERRGGEEEEGAHGDEGSMGRGAGGVGCVIGGI